MTEHLDKSHPQFMYTVNGREYTLLYWIVDGIYPEWRCFVKTIYQRVGDAQEIFAAAKKISLKRCGVRAFDGLQAQFAILDYPGRL